VRSLVAAIIAVCISAPSFAQTQPTRPTAYATAPTMPSAFATSPLSPCYPSLGDRPLLIGEPSLGDGLLYSAGAAASDRRRGYFNPTSPCYSGTIYPAYSAVTPLETPKKPTLRTALSQGANSLDEDQAKQLVEAKGYSKVSGLQKDSRGIWRAAATLKDGRPVKVILDLDGNIYSLPPSGEIRVRPLGRPEE